MAISERGGQKMNIQCPGCGCELYPVNRINWNDVNWCFECVYERSEGAVKDQMARVLGVGDYAERSGENEGVES